MSDHPFDFPAAQAAARKASTVQATAEAQLRQTVKDAAEAERAYREALAKRIVELRADGASATLAGDLARGDRHVAGLKCTRDVAEGMKEAAVQGLWRHAADRRNLDEFISWSRRAAFRDEPDESGAMFGARRAA